MKEIRSLQPEAMAGAGGEKNRRQLPSSVPYVTFLIIGGLVRLRRNDQVEERKHYYKYRYVEERKLYYRRNPRIHIESIISHIPHPILALTVPGFNTSMCPWALRFTPGPA
ncbi:hypothetical protein Pmani_029116 [Petrolisthes manimaculis]|uniref:Uncharacterized protein n=1 Tax=Petrolisthes manimaculis TaxID=1843537 RepID=A0AAE1TUS8_9EUCA|nr:hypothetical protein Pmani_029116 [Petrolisthes manimaculis]